MQKSITLKNKRLKLTYRKPCLLTERIIKLLAAKNIQTKKAPLKRTFTVNSRAFLCNLFLRSCFATAFYNFDQSSRRTASTSEESDRMVWRIKVKSPKIQNTYPKAKSLINSINISDSSKRTGTARIPEKISILL